MNPTLAGVLIFCTITITVAILVLVVFLIMTLIQVRRTARKAETFVHHLQHGVDVIGHISETVAGFADKLSSPWMKAGAWAFGLASSCFAKRKKEKNPSEEE